MGRAAPRRSLGAVIEDQQPPPRPRSIDVPGRATSVSTWLPTLRRVLVVGDLLVVSLACSVALLWRFGFEVRGVRGLEHSLVARTPLASHSSLAVMLVLAWVGLLSANSTRDRRVVGTGPEEYKRVLTASAQLFGALAIVSYLGHVEVARRFVAVAFPLGAVALVLFRYATRKWLHRRRQRGQWVHRVLVVGDRPHVGDLVAQLRRARFTGFSVVGVCLPQHTRRRDDVFRRDASSRERRIDSGGKEEDLPPVVGSLTTVAQAVDATGADTVAVVPSVEMGAAELRRLGWALEGRGVDLVVAPALTDVAGPRLHVRPVAGLPLLHVEAPQYEGPVRLLKGAFDLVCGSLLLVLVSPLMLLIALAVRLTSPGPVLFRQRRVGRNGETFTLFKFRSMVDGAEERLGDVASRNEHDGVLFKIRRDPRVTPVGRVMRRFSLDELPQLFNVLRREMSLVGPRPPLPSEVARYGLDVRRRLLVKPGITGLWQVSGRADLSWEDSVRLDLYYVENWSLTADLVILAKTVIAVLAGRGAY